jgi:hypothetical protein
MAGAVAGEFIWQNEDRRCGLDVMSGAAALWNMLADRGRVA